MGAPCATAVGRAFWPVWQPSGSAQAAPNPPGARILRDWEGQTHEILVADNGFLWRERTWRSLSAIAREITGARWSGPRFFGLDAGNGR